MEQLSKESTGQEPADETPKPDEEDQRRYLPEGTADGAPIEGESPLYGNWLIDDGYLGTYNTDPDEDL